MRKRKNLLITFLFIAVTFSAYAQTAEAIVSKCTAAMGGQEKLKALKTMHMMSTITIGQAKGTIITDIIYGKQYRNETAIGKDRIVICCSRSTGWKMDRVDSLGAQLKDREVSEHIGDLYPGGVLINYETLGGKLTLIGEGNVDGVNVIKLSVVLNNGNETTYFVNANTYQIVMEVRTINMNDTKRVRTYKYSDFRKTATGITLPFQTEVVTQGGSYIIAASDIAINKGIDEKIFEMHAKSK